MLFENPKEQERDELGSDEAKTLTTHSPWSRHPPRKELPENLPTP